MANREKPSSWLALEKGAVVHASDGTEVGKVGDVVGDEQKDIFSGIMLDTGLLHEDRFVPAPAIEEITDDGVKLNIDPEQLGKPKPPEDR